MDPFLAFFTWQFMLFSLSVAGVTFVVRVIADYFVKTIESKKIWEDVFLPIFPLILGCLMGWLIPRYPYPDGLVTMGGHIIFGMVAGMFSGVLYRAFKAILNVKISIDPTSLIPAPVSTFIPPSPPVAVVPMEPTTPVLIVPPAPPAPSLMEVVIDRRKQP